jgi:hypothetical protein
MDNHFAGLLTKRVVWGLRPDELKRCRRVAPEVLKEHPEADVEAIRDAVVFSYTIGCDNDADLKRDAIAYLHSHSGE